MSRNSSGVISPRFSMLRSLTIWSTEMPIPVPAFGGMTEDQAVQAIKDAPFTLVEPIVRQFDGAIAPALLLSLLLLAA